MEGPLGSLPTTSGLFGLPTGGPPHPMLHRRQGSDPPGNWDFTNALLSMGGEEELRCKSGELFVNGERINFVKAASSSDTMDENPNASDAEESKLTSSRKRKSVPKMVSSSDTSSDRDSVEARPSSKAALVQQAQQALTKPPRGVRGGYKCSKCGQRKTNHICSALDNGSIMTCAVGIQASVSGPVQQHGDRTVIVKNFVAFLGCNPGPAVVNAEKEKEKKEEEGGGKRGKGQGQGEAKDVAGETSGSV